MFNADLALSVTMTAISTLLSVIMLPVNLIIYATTSYSSAVVKSLDWGALFHSLVTVIGAITAGLICSATVSSHKFNLMANKVRHLTHISWYGNQFMYNSHSLFLARKCGWHCIGNVFSGSIQRWSKCGNMG
jgi:predicted Na+-dependent transporter